MDMTDNMLQLLTWHVTSKLHPIPSYDTISKNSFANIGRHKVTT